MFWALRAFSLQERLPFKTSLLSNLRLHYFAYAFVWPWSDTSRFKSDLCQIGSLHRKCLNTRARFTLGRFHSLPISGSTNCSLLRGCPRGNWDFMSLL